MAMAQHIINVQVMQADMQPQLKLLGTSRLEDPLPQFMDAQGRRQIGEARLNRAVADTNTHHDFDQQAQVGELGTSRLEEPLPQFMDAGGRREVVLHYTLHLLPLLRDLVHIETSH